MENYDRQKDLPAHISHVRAQDSSSSSQPASDEVTFSHHEHDNFQKEHQDEDLNNTHPHPHSYPFHAEHGPPIDNAMKYDEAEEDYQHHKNLWWSRVRHHLRDPFAEFMGTFIMILFGDGSVAQVSLSMNPKLPKSSQNKGDYQSISWGCVFVGSPFFYFIIYFSILNIFQGLEWCYCTLLTTLDPVLESTNN